MSSELRLYGMPGSLYTAKARAYLRKQRLPLIELPVGDADFAHMVAVAGRFIMPILRDADGTVVQDGAAIIDHIEASGRARLSAFPDDGLLRTLSLIFELFGGEGLLRPAMHYRWNFDAENLAFLRRDFVAALAPKAEEAQANALFGMASGRMRKAGASFGVSPETYEAVEESYAEFLGLLDAHLATMPYLLGGRPTIGDYGLVGPLYAHLARDPAPARLMQATAYNVWRWTERMNAAAPLLDGLVADESLMESGAIPPTLRGLLAFVARDYLPELSASVAFANGWLDAQPDLVVGTNGLTDPAQRSIGRCSFVWRGHQIEAAVLPYRFWLLQRVQDSAAALGTQHRTLLAALLDEVGLASLLTLQTRRRVERRNHLEVWGDLRD